MPDEQRDKENRQSRPLPPPAPPPLPPLKDASTSTSPVILKLRPEPLECFFPPEQSVSFVSPAGPYFFYGTLSDPGMLRDILGLGVEPQLRPATVKGYECKQWGQYPAVVDNPDNVRGFVYNVETEEHAKRLARYETGNYQAKPCRIDYTDKKEPMEDLGHIFVFVGNRRDLSDGTFDLETWLRRMGRVIRSSSAVK